MRVQKFVGAWTFIAKNGGVEFSTVVDGGATTTYGPTQSVTSPTRVPATGGATATWSFQTATPLYRQVQVGARGITVFLSNDVPELVIVCTPQDPALQIATGGTIDFTLPAGSTDVTHGPITHDVTPVVKK